ncbi:aldehyde dehydrogenase family protein [Yinghuangia seranimata]|uniref:aldehyde dehydrogenase family protein n=1 Tax=Yinghuangia seranimata TaxID=408067 RepID=UPI00248C8465|nr:aldehyde dehydrogenase family protein [Yinghuangia seranimata]MDI2124702.1 aldehyde dehydrogenase family protein [Yinghuangia seranimata]
MTHYQLFINGAFVDGAGSEVYEVRSPATGELVGTTPVPTTADVDAAVAAANAAQREWGRRTVWERAAICVRIADEIDKRVDELARLTVLEQGKPLAEAVTDIHESAMLMRFQAEDATRLHGDTMPSLYPNKRMFTTYRPVGTWGIVTPWNFPFHSVAEFVGPGLAMGNALVVKPPANTPLSVLKAMEAFAAAGLPDGLVSVLPGDGTVGEALVSHRGIDAIGFIGSSATAERILSTAGLKRSIMECSGNGPVVVLADADVEAAARAAVYGASFLAGQVCCATERVIVHQDVHDEFVDAVLRAAEAVVLGDPFDPATTMGPLNNEGVAAKMDRHVADARARGAKVLLGGGRRPGMPTDLYYEFTVIDQVPVDSLVSREESFGPVVPIITGVDDDDLLRIANDDELGLQGAVFTKDMGKAFRFVEEMAVGQVIVNDSTCFWDANMPFGGAGGRRTGWGRMGSKLTLQAMSDVRTGVFSL